MTNPAGLTPGANPGGPTSTAPPGQSPLNAQNLVDPSTIGTTGTNTNTQQLGVGALNALIQPPPMKTFIYAPAARIVIAHNEIEYDVSADLVRGSLHRPENSAATLFFTLHNKGLRYTPPASTNPFFSRMDRVVVYMKKTSWIQVFSGYLDTVPYKQLYAGTVDFKATCTIKRLMHTWWDPALPEAQSLFNQMGENFAQGDGLGQADSGMGSMLFNIMNIVGGWGIGDIHIQNFPTSFLQFLTTMVAQLQSSNAPAVQTYEQNLLGANTTPGPGAYAGFNANAGNPGPSAPTGAAAAGGQAFYVTQIIAACDAKGLGPLVTDNTLSAALLQAGATGEAGTNSMQNPGTQKAWQQIQSTGQQMQQANRSSDGAILGVACALVESQMRNVYNPSVSGSESFPNDGPTVAGGDGMGLFLQNVTWGTIAQCMNPQQAAGMFFAALQNVSGWRQMDPGQAIAQAQRSDNASVALFDAQIATATSLVQAARTSQAGTASSVLPSGSVTLSGTSAPAAASSLGALSGATGGAPSSVANAVTGGATIGVSPASGVSMVNPTSAVAPVPNSEGAINFMRSCLGLPYVWGGTGPAGYDCLAKGTLVTTSRGEVPIEEVSDSDYVLTRRGYRRVIRAWKVRDDAELTEIRVNGRSLRGTPDHRVWTENRGWIALRDVTHYDTLVSCHRVTNPFGEKTSSSRGTPTPATQIPLALLTGRIFSDQESLCTLPSGNTTTDERSLRDTRSTTLITTPSTTTRRILSAKSFRNTDEKAKHTVGCTTTSARSVGQSFRPIAHRSASSDFVVVSTSRSSTTTNVKLRRSVYDLWVEGEHEFFANGVLVHNCSGLMQSGFKAIGVAIPRTAAAIGQGLTRVPYTAIQRGDMVCPTSGHIVMWLGDGTILEAQQTGVPIHIAPASNLGNPSSWFAVVRACANGGPNPSAPFNPPALMGPGQPPAALAQTGGALGAGSNGSQEAVARNLFSYIFTPDAMSASTAGEFTGLKAFIEGQPLIQTVQAICAASLRCWSSAPNGSFMAWYPDYWGLDGKPAVMLLADIEMKDCSINFSDDPLTTHVYINGDLTMTGQLSDPVEGWLSTAGVATVEQPWLYTRLLTVAPGDLEEATGQQIMQRFGIRPLQQSYALAGGTTLEFLLACQIFMEQWAKQYQTVISMTFMPELFPGMRVELPDRNLQVYVNAVSHNFDYEQGFYTQVTISAPSSPQAAAMLESTTSAVQTAATSVINNITTNTINAFAVAPPGPVPSGL